MVSQGEWCDLARLLTKDTVPGHYLQYGIDGSSPCSRPAGYASNNPLASHTTGKTNHYHPQKIQLVKYITGQINHWPLTPPATPLPAHTPPVTYTTSQYTTGQYTTGQYTTGQYTTGQYTTGQYTTGQYTTANTPPAMYTAGQIHHWPLTQPAIYITGHMHLWPLTLPATYTTGHIHHWQ